MRRTFWFGLITSILLAGLAAACGGDEMADTAVCDYTTQTAVTLDLRDENGNPQRLVRVRYRVDDGPWQQLPESVNETAVLRDGPGTYQIHVEKPGYAPNEITVVVPAPEGDSCEVAAEAATLPMSLAVCPNTEPTFLEIEVVSASEEVVVTAVAQPGGTQPLTCADETATNCSLYTLPLTRAAKLRLTVEDLGGIGPMQVDNGVVGYALNDSQLILRQNGLSHSHTVSGANSLNAALDVTLDEVGCPLADFRTLDVQVEPDVTSGDPYPTLRVFQLSNLTMTDLGAAGCQNTPQLYPVRFQAELPNGTRLDDVSVQTFTAGEWQPAECEVGNGRYLCTAALPNPLIRQPYAYKIVVGDEEYTGTSLPFDTLCLIFD